MWSSAIFAAGLALLCCSAGAAHGHQHARHSIKALMQARKALDREPGVEEAVVAAAEAQAPAPLCLKTTVLSFADEVAAEEASKKGWMTQDDWGAELRKINASQHKTVRVGIDGFPCAERGCCQHEMRIRLGGSDWYVLQHAINELGGALDRLRGFRPAAVLDAGGNIGVATTLFAMLYPDAMVLALDPEPENCALLQANTARFPNVRVACLGLWDAPGKAVMLEAGRDGMPWAWRLREVPAGSPGALQTTSVQALLEQHGLPAFDLVKLDIEGAEFTVLGEGAERGWLADTQVLLGEIHEGYGDGNALRASLRSAGFKASTSGEYDAFHRPSVPISAHL